MLLGMKFLFRFLGLIIVNAVALIAATRLVPGFTLSGEVTNILLVALVLTLFNILLKPILKLVLSPFIIITLGLGLIIVNAIILYVLDIAMESLTIESIPALLIATLVISFVNFILHIII